ncbi:MAG: type II secretion system F family protein [Candidatus Omnitrophica bacterium]|nr:type II secretion system F family protein [Candidatus Omnitrophota bacterium]
MPDYAYKGRNEDGRSVDGVITAISEDAAIKQVLALGITINTLKERVDQQINPATVRKKKSKTRKKVKGEDLHLFTTELATLLDSGVSLVRSLEIVSTQIRSEKLAHAVKSLSTDIKSGSTLKDAMAKHPKVFPAVWEHIIDAGEMSGKLPFVLAELGRSLAMIEGIRKKVVSALIYPGVLICVAIGAILLFMTKIIPVFATLFEQFDKELPAITQAVIGLSEFLQKGFIYYSLGSVCIFLLLRSYFATERGKDWLHRTVLKLPVVGSLLKDAIIARISVNLAILIRSGVNFVQALDVTAKTSGNRVFENALQKIMEEVKSGVMLSEAMMNQPLFSVMMTQMLTVGEEIGKIDEMLSKIGEYYESRVNVFADRLGTLIEPAIMVIVGTIVGILVIAMFLPMFTMSDIL